MRLKRPPFVLWRYIALEVVAILAVALFIQVAINVSIVTFQLVQQGLRLGLVVPILIKLATLSLYYTIPISLLFAVTLGIGRMVADLEVTALKASGVSYAQIMTPVLGLGLAAFLVTLYLNDSVIPSVRYERRNLRKVILSQLCDLRGDDINVELRHMGQLQCGRCYGNVWHDVVLNVWDIGRLAGSRPPGPKPSLDFPITIRARWARVERGTNSDGKEQLVVHLHGAKVSVPDSVLRGASGDDLYLQQLGFEYYRLPISLSDAGQGTKDKQTAALKIEVRDRRVALARVEEKLKVEKDHNEWKRLEAQRKYHLEEIRDMSAEIARRRAFAFSCFSFLWLGVPLTIWLNSRNRLVPFFVGNIAAIGIFYPLVTLGVLLGSKGDSPGLMLQSGNLVLLVAGGVILWRLRKA